MSYEFFDFVAIFRCRFHPIFRRYPVNGYDQSTGYLGKTNVNADPAPKWGMSVSGPSAGVIAAGGTLASADLDFKNNCSEIYGATSEKSLGARIFNAEGQRYFHLNTEIERCCE